MELQLDGPRASGWPLFFYSKARKKGNGRRMGLAIASILEGSNLFQQDYLTSNSEEIEDGFANINILHIHDLKK